MDRILASSDHLIFKGRNVAHHADLLTHKPTPKTKTNAKACLAPFTGSIPLKTILKDVTDAANTTEKDAAHDIEDQNSAVTDAATIKTLDVNTNGCELRRFGATDQQVADGRGDSIAPDDVQRLRMIKAALNKLTPRTYEKTSRTILDIISHLKQDSGGRTLQLISARILEMATMGEVHLAPMYAKLCSEILDNVSDEAQDSNLKDKQGHTITGANLFRKFLLNPCQDKFEKALESSQCQMQDGESEDAATLFDKYFNTAIAKRHCVGLTRFIGELFKVGMLTERIMHECVKRLLDYDIPGANEVESLDALLRVIGEKLDNPESKAQGRMDVYFERLWQCANYHELEPRLKPILTDLINLRKAGWQDKTIDKGP